MLAGRLVTGERRRSFPAQACRRAPLGRLGSDPMRLGFMDASLFAIPERQGGFQAENGALQVLGEIVAIAAAHRDVRYGLRSASFDFQPPTTSLHGRPLQP